MSLFEPKKRLAEEFGDYGPERNGIMKRLVEAYGDYREKESDLRKAVVREARDAIRAAAAVSGGRLAFEIPEVCEKYNRARMDEEDIPEAEREKLVSPGGMLYMDAMLCGAVETRILTDDGELTVYVESVQCDKDGAPTVTVRDVRGQAYELSPIELPDPEAVLEFIMKTL